ncbi:MAG: hypothetical protein JO340_16180 [Acidobacteriaceae bacterium]|nr:hypothetical protein [Acidobacteriaceae bacterium]
MNEIITLSKGDISAALEQEAAAATAHALSGTLQRVRKRRGMSPLELIRDVAGSIKQLAAERIAEQPGKALGKAGETVVKANALLDLLDKAKLHKATAAMTPSGHEAALTW